MGTPYCCTVLVHQYGRRKSKKTSGVCDKHPLELGAYSKSAPHGSFGYFLELYKVVYPGIYSVFYKVVISSFFPTAVVLRVVE